MIRQWYASLIKNMAQFFLNETFWTARVPRWAKKKKKKEKKKEQEKKSVQIDFTKTVGFQGT